MRIREIQAEDRDEWLRLLLDLYAGSTEKDHSQIVDAYLAGASTNHLIPDIVLVAERSGSALGGFLELSVRNYAEGCVGATPYIESWYVDPDIRRSGIGRKLVEAAELWALSQGYRELASDAELSNAASHSAHEAVGFTEVERVVHYRKRIHAASGHGTETA